LMFYLGDALRSMATSLRNAFRRPTTVEFPDVQRERPERFRSSFALLHDEGGDERCVGCKACERICPSQVISVTTEKREAPGSGKMRAYASEFVLDANACIYCELCVQVCPTDALVMVKPPEEPKFSRQELVLTKERLYDNEKRRPLSWATATRLSAMQSPEQRASAGTAGGKE
jgi:NADH-quinone oxidoreductase subunit I